MRLMGRGRPHPRQTPAFDALIQDKQQTNTRQTTNNTNERWARETKRATCDVPQKKFRYVPGRISLNVCSVSDRQPDVLILEASLAAAHYVSLE